MRLTTRLMLRALASLLLAVSLGCEVLAADQARLGVGATLETLRVGAVTYQRVQVRTVTARTITITHAGGMASVRLRDLSPELQAAFGYQPEAEAAADAALKDAQARAAQTRAAAAQTKPAFGKQTAAASGAQFDRLMQSFGQPPEIRASVDLRPKFLALALNVKNQGPRPSCAVFAIVSALEYQNAQLTGRPERFSEEYLLWATCKTLNRVSRVPSASAGGDAENADPTDPGDEGFALSEVVTALRAYGVPTLDAMPYTAARASDIDPKPELIAEARTRRRVSVFALPGRDATVRTANLIHALNAGVPIAVGLNWPQFRTLRSGYLSAQEPLPGSGHAVTMVGYENKTGAIADTVFIFKNSWGARWGAGGYGYATYDYVTKNLNDTALLEVEAGDGAH